MLFALFVFNSGWELSQRLMTYDSRLKNSALEVCFFISNVHGYTQGLKHNQLRRIEKLSTRRVTPSEIVSPELARQMTEI